jgi:hypothetical protein
MTEKIMQVVHFNEEGIRMCMIEKFYMDKKLQKVLTCMINTLYNPTEFLRPSSDVKVM